MRPADRLEPMVSCAVAVWLVGYAFLHLKPSLPMHYDAAHWRFVWIGFDVGLASTTFLTGALLRLRSRYAALTAAGSAALFLCDAWFDCMTARGENFPTALWSLGGEIPAAFFFIWLAIRSLKS